GFSNRPLRTRSDGNIDVEFAANVWSAMEGWNAERVVVAVDTENEAVLYIYDNGSTTTIIPFMAQQGVWNAPLNLSARIIDAQVVNGTSYITYLNSSNYRVNQWEGRSDIGGSPYISSQFYDPRMLKTNRLKSLIAAGKIASLSVYAVTPGVEIPD